MGTLLNWTEKQSNFDSGSPFNGNSNFERLVVCCATFVTLSSRVFAPFVHYQIHQQQTIFHWQFSLNPCMLCFFSVPLSSDLRRFLYLLVCTLLVVFCLHFLFLNAVLLFNLTDRLLEEQELTRKKEEFVAQLKSKNTVLVEDRIPAKGVRFSSWECQDFQRRHDHIRRFRKTSEGLRRRPKISEDVPNNWEPRMCIAKHDLVPSLCPQKTRDSGKSIVFFSFLLFYMCQLGCNSYIFFNQAWGIGVVGVNSKFSTLGRESWQVE